MSMPAASPALPPQGSNRRILAILAIVVLLMVGLAYASVPLYQLFCQVPSPIRTRSAGSEKTVGQKSGRNFIFIPI